MPITMDQFRAVSGTDNQIGMQGPASLTVRGGSFLGRSVSWFTPARDPSVVAQENRDVMQSFMQALRAEYGEAVGNIALAAQGIANDSAVPLTGRMVRQVLRDADTTILLLTERKQDDINMRLEAGKQQIRTIENTLQRLGSLNNSGVVLTEDDKVFLLSQGIAQDVIDGPASELPNAIGTKMGEVALSLMPLHAAQTALTGELRTEQTALFRSARALLGPGGMTSEEVRALPTGQKAMLAEALGEKVKNGTEAEKQEALHLLKVLHSKIVPADYSPPSESAKRADLHGRLRNDPTIKLARDQWQSLTTEQKKAVLQTISEHHARSYGLPSSPLQYEDLPAGTYGDCNRIRVRINAKILDTASFTEMADTVIHENTHRYQYGLVDQLNAGQLPPTDDRYGQALLMRANDHCYLSADTYGYAAYRGQPNERHAFDEGGVGQQVIAALV